MNLNILVTGAGGDIAQSISRILRDTDFCNKLIGSDLHLKHAGKLFFDKVVLLPPAFQNDYFDGISNLTIKENIDLVIPASEQEILFFSINDLTQVGKAKILTANKKAIQICSDKLKTVEFLKGNNLPYPITKLVREVNTPFLPAIMKARSSSGSKSIIKIYTKEDFDYYAKKYPDFIIQEMLISDEEEYTCGVFRSKIHGTKYIIFKRTLKGGLTGYGEVVSNKKINELLDVISDLLELEGSINVQLRLREGEPYVFEINPRFSSTVRFRHMLGFEDLLWSIYEKLQINYVMNYQDVTGSIIYRVYDEFITKQ